MTGPAHRPALDEARTLDEARALFLARWGELGPAWGVSRTESQVHALLMVAPEALNTDQVMTTLAISRGNAHAGLQELCAWGLVERVRRPGDRKDYYAAEKDVWVVVQRIVRARKRKELEPVLEALERCLEATRGLRGAEARAFRRQLTALQRFAALADRAMERLVRLRSTALLSWIARFLR